MGRKYPWRRFNIHFRATGLNMSKELILIIEDNEKNLKLMRDLLQFKEYTTLESQTAEEGLEMVVKSIPALILMDIQLPGMNGIEALKILRSRSETRNIPVIAVTASVATHDEKDLLSEGFDEYLPKPIDIYDFLQCA